MVLVSTDCSSEPSCSVRSSTCSFVGRGLDEFVWSADSEAIVSFFRRQPNSPFRACPPEACFDADATFG